MYTYDAPYMMHAIRIALALLRFYTTRSEEERERDSALINIKNICINFTQFRPVCLAN